MKCNLWALNWLCLACVTKNVHVLSTVPIDCSCSLTAFYLYASSVVRDILNNWVFCSLLHLFSFFVLLLTVQWVSDTKNSCYYAWKQALSFSNTFNIYIFWERHKMTCGTDLSVKLFFLAALSPLLDCIASIMRLFSSISALHTHQDQHFCSDIWAFVPVLMWLQMKWRMRQEETEVLDGHPSILRNLQWVSLWAAVFFVSLLGC